MPFPHTDDHPVYSRAEEDLLKNPVITKNDPPEDSDE